MGVFIEIKYFKFFNEQNFSNSQRNFLLFYHLEVSIRQIFISLLRCVSLLLFPFNSSFPFPILFCCWSIYFTAPFFHLGKINCSNVLHYKTIHLVFLIGVLSIIFLLILVRVKSSPIPLYICIIFVKRWLNKIKMLKKKNKRVSAILEAKRFYRKYKHISTISTCKLFIPFPIVKENKISRLPPTNTFFDVSFIGTNRNKKKRKNTHDCLRKAKQNNFSIRQSKLRTRVRNFEITVGSGGYRGRLRNADRRNRYSRNNYSSKQVPRNGF